MIDYKCFQFYFYKKNVIVINWWYNWNIYDFFFIVMYMVNRKIDLKLNFFMKFSFLFGRFLF